MMGKGISASIVVLCAIFAGPAWAQGAAGYPAKTIRLIVPLSPGGPSDILGRTIAQKMSENLKQNVVVDNRPGAGGTLGTDLAAKAPPDGYTLLLIGVSTYTINASLYRKLPYDPHKDLAPVSVLAEAPYILAVHPSLPVKTLKDLIALDRARPGQLNYASGGSGTGPHLAMELLLQQTGMKMTHIPYKGAGPALNDLVAGHVPVQMVNMIAGLPLAKTGRIRAIGVSTAKRSSAAPEIPPLAETGAPGYNTAGQHLVMVPAGTPRDIVEKLNRELVRVLHLPEVKERLASEGAEVIGGTPQEAATIVRNDIEKWAQVVRRLGLQAN